MIDPAVLRKMSEALQARVVAQWTEADKDAQRKGIGYPRALKDFAFEFAEEVTTAVRAALVQELEKYLCHTSDCQVGHINWVRNVETGHMEHHGEKECSCGLEAFKFRLKLLTGDARHGQEQG